MLDLKVDVKGLKTDDDVAKAAAKIGTGHLVDTSIFIRFATWLMALGLAFKNGTFKPNKFDLLPVFIAFDTAFRDASNGFRKPLAASSVKTWVSAFGAYWEAGQWTAYPIEDIAEKTMNLSGPFTSRGARLREVMETYKTVAPTEAELDAILNPIVEDSDNPVNDWARTFTRATDPDKLSKPKKGETDTPVWTAIQTDKLKLAAYLKFRIACETFTRETMAKTGEAPAKTAEELLAEVNASIAAEKAAGSPNGSAAGT